MNQHQNHCDALIKLANNYKKLQQTNLKNICWNWWKQPDIKNNKNFKNVAEKLNHDLHKQKVNGIARDFKNMIAWNICMNFSLHCIKIIRWKVRKPWSYIYNTFFWWYQTLWNLPVIQVCANIQIVNKNKTIALKLSLSKNDGIRAKNIKKK